ncbi:MAG: RNA methyltransferase [Hyphomicrobiaceae bacterium]
MPGPAAEVIRSFGNERIKRARALDDRKVRRETGLFRAEGRDKLARARRGGFQPSELFLVETTAGESWARELAEWAEAGKAPVSWVSAPVMAKLSAMANASPVVALLKQRYGSLPAVHDLQQADTWLVLEEIRDPGNLGTIIRTADAAGAKGVVLVGHSADPFSPEAVRASAGSLFALPIVEAPVATITPWIACWPGLVLGSAATGADDYRNAADRHPVLLLIGSEAKGLSAELTGLCHRLARIPMAGSTESLNAAIATAILLFEVRRRFLDPLT